MRPLPLILLLTSFQAFSAYSQTPDSKTTDAWLITRMAEKFHVQPRPLDKTMAAAIYSRMLEALDEERIFFTQADIARLSVYRNTLDEEILNRRTGFLQLLTTIYQQRLMQADTLIDHIAAKPFTFSATTREKLTVAEDTTYPADPPAMQLKLYKLLKLYVADGLANAILAAKATPRARIIDSLEPRLRKRAVVSIKRMIRRLQQSPKGIGNILGIIYCQSLAACYDPHTAYFSPDEKAAFESALGNKPLSYGLSLNEDDDGHATVGRLEPGGPAFQSGSLNDGDKILSVRWDGKEPIDVSDAGAAELSRVLSAEGGDKLTLNIRKTDGTTRQVSLKKQKVNTQAMDEEEDKVKGFLLKGASTIGYISLPAFYEDWEGSNGVNGCANDVAREIIKLRKENIGGLILDLRYNGGGSMREAVDLAGLFIDAGPVGQVKTKDGKIYTLKDITRGTIWDGPLVVLVNGSSASASEMVAGTLQDYNRALIVGSPTYGKATAQIVLPLDTTVDITKPDPGKQASAYLKITTSKLFRVNGTTAQVSGVRPDIVLPDPPEAATERESDEPFVLPPTPIEANKYYHPLAPLPLAAEQAIATKAIAGNAFFRKTAAASAASPRSAVTRHDDVPLNLDELIAEKKKHVAEVPTGTPTDTLSEKNTTYVVANPAYELRRLQTDDDLREENEIRKEEVLEDPYILVAWLLTAGLIKP
jgi:carboxyl-terminal processing protease